MPTAPTTTPPGAGARAPSGAPVAGTVDARAIGWARTLAGTASLGAAAVHAAAIPVHLDHGTRYGVAFVVMAVAGTLGAVAPVISRGRRGLLLTVVVNAAIIGLWFLATTRGVAGDDKESIGTASAVATMLELAAVSAAAVGLAFSSSALAAAPAATATRLGWRASLVAVIAVSLLAAPGVATAADHQHGAHVDAADDHASTDHPATSSSGHDHPNQEYGVPDAIAASTITGIFSWAPAAVHAGGSGNAVHDDGAASAPCAPSDGQVAAADALVAQTTLALLHFRDPATAVAEGYRPLGFEPNGINHYLHEAEIARPGTLDAAHPESILYGRAKDGSLYPVGAMYMVSTDDERGSRIGGCLTPWHRHGFPFARPGETSPEMMHVWTVPMPGGPYAEHVEGEYARLYLGVDPIDTDGVTSAVSTTGATGAAASSSAFDELAGLFGGAGGSFGVGAVLNAVNVHRASLCAAPLRDQLLARVGDAKLVDRVCDPVLNGPLPGATAPDMATILKLVAGNRTGK